MNWNKKIYNCYFTLYDLNDFYTPIYFDDIYEFLDFNYMTERNIGKLVYRFNHSEDNFIIIRCVRDSGNYYKLYAFEDDDL